MPRESQGVWANLGKKSLFQGDPIGCNGEGGLKQGLAGAFEGVASVRQGVGVCEATTVHSLENSTLAMAQKR